MTADARIIARILGLCAKADDILAGHHSKPFRDRQVWYVDGAAATSWSTSVSSLLSQVFGEQSVHYRAFDKHLAAFHGYEGEFKLLRAVLLSAKEDLEGGYLFTIRGLVKAELLDDALSQAGELLSSGYKDPACVLVGVSLELALKELVLRAGLASGKLDAMNVSLCKAGTYNIAKQKQITAWADLRIKSAHGDWSSYTEADVADMLTGIQRFIADHM